MKFAITVRCASCSQAFRVQRSIKTIEFKQPTYCINCGSQNLAIIQDHELDADEALAEHFNLRVEKFREVYEVWQNFANEYPRLADFIAMVRARNNVQKPTTTGS